MPMQFSALASGVCTTLTRYSACLCPPASIGACERIKSTPMPFGYVAALRGFLLMFLFTLPFTMVGTFHTWAIGGQALIAFIFLDLVSQRAQPRLFRHRRSAVLCCALLGCCCRVLLCWITRSCGLTPRAWRSWPTAGTNGNGDRAALWRRRGRPSAGKLLP